jgi:hypothetical protein
VVTMNSREWIIAIIVLVAAVVVVLVTLSASTTSTYPKTVSTTNSSLGLMFSVTLNTTQLHSGQTLNITAYATNDRSTLNNLSFAQNWAEPWFVGWLHIGTCYSFANADVFHGYYDASNVSIITNSSDGTGLQLAKLLAHYCPVHYGEWFTFFPFQPHQSHVGYHFSTSGYYPSDVAASSFRLFESGTYTVVAGDEWGQLVIAHFSVLP